MERHFMTDHAQWIQLLDSLKLYEEIKLEEMPEYRLYISQLEEFFDKKLGRVSGDEDERKTISKTMIQNYIKDGLLMPPEGKCYNRNHVILLILIYNLKPIISIKDIKKLLSPILTDVDNEDNYSEIEHLYRTYLNLKEGAVRDFNHSLTADLKRIAAQPKLEDMTDGEWDRLSLLLMVVTLVTEANAKKKLAEHLIDKFFHYEDTKEGV